MKLDKYLIINSRGGVSIRERTPRLGGNEIALRIRLEVPDGLFKRPILEAQLAIPIEAIPQTVITPQITQNIEQIVKDATGLNLVVSVIEQPAEKEK